MALTTPRGDVAAVATGAPRLGFLDSLRALAAVSVLIQHSLEGGGIQSLAAGSVATSWVNFGVVGVAVFFLISGFVIPASMRGSPSFSIFWIRRVLRIYPLYWVVFLAGFGFAMYSQADTPDLVPTLASHALFLQSWIGLPNFVGGSWTLLLELLWYACFSLAFYSRIGVGLRLVSALMASVPIVLAMSMAMSNLPLGRFCIIGLCFWGYLYFLYANDIINQKLFILFNLAFGCSIGALLFVGFYLQPNDSYGAPDFRCVAISYALGVAMFAGSYRFRHARWINMAWLRYLGEISFSLYLVHSFVIGVLKYLGISGYSLVALTIGLTVGISSLTYRLVERPGIVLSRSLSSKLRARQA